MLPTKIQGNWHFGSGEKVKNRFSRNWLQPRQPSWISNRKDLATFDLQVTKMLPIKEKKSKVDLHVQDGCHGRHLEFRIWTILLDLQVTWCFLPSFTWPLGSEEEMKNRFSWISDQINFSYFWSTSHWGFLPSFKSIGFLVQEKKQKIDFQDGCHGGHLGFQTGMILAIFDLQVTLMLPTKFRVKGPRGVGGVDF